MKEAMQSVWIGIWSWFEGSWSGIKRKKWKKWQKRVEKLCFSISHEHAKNSHSRAKWTRKKFGYSSKGKLKTDFAWPCEMLQEGEIGADAFSTSHNCVKLLELVQNCIFSRSLSEEASRRPLRWCQVSTWPWSINRNLIYSFEDFRHFLIVKFSRFPLYKILYFSSFSLIFSLAKHVLWD